MGSVSGQPVENKQWEMYSPPACRNIRKLSDLKQEDRWMRRGVDGLWLSQPVCEGQCGWLQENINSISRASPWQKYTNFLSLKLLIYAYNSILVLVFLQRVSALSGKFKASPGQRHKKAHFFSKMSLLGLFFKKCTQISVFPFRTSWFDLTNLLINPPSHTH